MPNPSDFQNQDDFMAACVPMRMQEGDGNEQAVGACMGMWKEHMSAKGSVTIADPTALQPIAVKAAADDYTLEILGVPFGGPNNGRDSQKERFTAKTNLHLDKFPKIPLVLAHGLNPDTGKPAGQPEYIGTAEYLRTDERGHWFKGVLDRTKQIAGELWDAAKRGVLAASSGSIAHLTRVSNDGTITEWPVAEMTLVDTTKNVRPVNSYAVAMPMMKANYEIAGIAFPDIEPIPPAEKPEGKPEAAKVAASEGAKAADQNNKENFEMDELDTKVQAAVKAALDAKAAEDAAKAEKARVEAIEAENAKLKEEAAKGRRLPFNGQAPAQAQFADTNAYDHLSPADLALAITLGQSLTASNNQGKDVRLGEGAHKALAIKVIEDKSDGVDPDLSSDYPRQAMKAAGLPMDKDAYKATTDPMVTTGTTDGGNWVHTAWSRDIWNVLRAPVSIVGRIPEQVIPDGSKSATIPLEGTDFTWYTVAQTSAADGTMKVPAASVTASQITTPTNLEITVAKMGARGLFAAELTEDSIIAFVPQARQQLITSGKEQLEHAVIDGDTDTTATTNINHIGGTPTAGDLYLMLNGLRKLCLITNTANSRTAAGGFVIEDFIKTLQLMGTAGLAAADLSKVNFIVDPNVWFAAMNLPEVKTRDVNSAATVENGFLKRAYSVELLPSWFMHFKSTARKANTAGKVNQTDQTLNTTGAILGVRWDQWKFAYKRQMTIETTRFANSDSYEIVSWARVGLLARDNEASAISYNVGV